jgi:polar amino acid transport system substrate-binding protein
MVSLAVRYWKKNLSQLLWRKAHTYLAFLLALIALLGLLYFCTRGKEWHNHVYRIARTSQWSVLPTLADKQKNIDAFAVELLLAIAEQEQFQFQLFEVSPSSLLQELDQREYDAILSFVKPSHQNERQYHFSDPLYLTGLVLVVTGSSRVNKWEQMEGAIVGIVQGASLVFDLDRYPAFLITTYPTIAQALMGLEKNSVDGIVLDLPTAFAYAAGLYAGKLKIILPPMTDEGLRLVTLHTPEAKALITRFNAGLQALQKSGRYQALVKKWGLPTKPD